MRTNWLVRLAVAALMIPVPVDAQAPERQGGPPPGAQRTPPRAMRPGERGAAGHGRPARVRRRRRHRRADPPRAGAGLGPRGAGHAHHDHRRAGPLRAEGAGRRPLHRDRVEGRVRDAAVRPAPAERARHAGGSAGRPDAREGGDRAAARQRHRRTHRRRVRRAADRRAGVGAAICLRERRAAAAPGRTGRPHRRSGRVPRLRAAARRVLRDGDAARRSRPAADAARRRRAVERLRADLLPRHDQRRRRAARGRQPRRGSERRGVRPHAGAAGSRLGPRRRSGRRRAEWADRWRCPTTRCGSGGGNVRTGQMRADGSFEIAGLAPGPLRPAGRPRTPADQRPGRAARRSSSPAPTSTT